MKTLYIILLLSLVGCMSASKHYQKAIKKGYTPEKETITKRTFTLLPIHDTITMEVMRVDTVISEETRTIYQDRPITRQERKAIKDSINHIEALFNNKLKTVKVEANKLIKLADKKAKEAAKAQKEAQKAEEKYKKELESINKSQNKRIRWWLWMLIGGVIVYFRKHLFKLIKLLPL